MAVTQATTLADFTSGIGTAGAVFQVDNANNRIGIGTTNPQTLLDVDGDATFRGDALFGDSDKAVFGAGQTCRSIIIALIVLSQTLEQVI